MSRNVLSGNEVRFLNDRFIVENASWKGVILQRAQNEERRRQKRNVTESNDPDEIVPSVVFDELGVESPLPPVDPVQTAEQEAETLLARSREEAEAIAHNIREDAKARAAMMVEKAQAEAKEVLQNAKAAAEAEVEKIKKAAEEDGRKAGFDQGKAEGLEKAHAECKAEYADVLRHWNDVLVKTIEERKRAILESRPLMVDLVGEALYQCLKDEAARRPEMVLRFVGEALQKAHDRVHLRVHLNPSDLGIVEAKKKEFQVSIGTSGIEFVADGRIEKGGCLLETEMGSIDARLSTIVSQVKDTLEDLGDRGV